MQTNQGMQPLIPLNNNDSRAVRFVVDNTYKSIPRHLARMDQTGNHLMVHEYTLYVDIIKGNPDLIERVRFDVGTSSEPRTFVCSSPVKVIRPNGLLAWRFATTQQCYIPSKATVAIRGIGGSMTFVTHNIHLNGKPKRRRIYAFREPRIHMPLRMLRLDDNKKYGIELELSSPPDMDPSRIADMMPRNAGEVIVVGSHQMGKQHHRHGWKIVPDGSIVCNRNMPSCNKFELVSNVLRGGDGLQQIAAIVRSLGEANIQINKSMGFHVHVDVSDYSTAQLIKICQNFIKYEDVMDSFMPPSRRTGSPECDRFFSSNRASVSGCTNKQRHDSLAKCRDLDELIHQMNLAGRYYKLNLDNLRTGRQTTIEFRQHSASFDYKKISSWVRFCIRFVQASALYESSQPFREDLSLKYQFDALFEHVIKDRALRDFYLKRRNQVDCHCCNECSNGRVHHEFAVSGF